MLRGSARCWDAGTRTQCGDFAIGHCREVCGKVGERFMRGGGRRNRRVWAQGLRHALSGVVVLHCSLFGVEGSKSPNEFWFVALLRAGRSQGRRFELGVGPVTPF